MTSHGAEVARGERFEFGANWVRFLSTIGELRILEAERSLQTMLGRPHLQGTTFLDAGSGSGLFSLAASRLGAAVRSFDFDPKSVACTREMKRRFCAQGANWTIEEGSVLDQAYLATLGQFDVVYSWGVLHHTGAMWEAMDKVVRLVAPRGHLFIAIYNDQGRASRRWRFLKRAYNKHSFLRPFLLAYTLLRTRTMSFVRDLLRGKPLASWIEYEKTRGMSAWHDVRDWIGGYPFEVAKPEEVLVFCKERGLRLERVVTCGGGLGCNQYLFAKEE